MQICNQCQGTGFLNADDPMFDGMSPREIREFIIRCCRHEENDVCNCCGDGCDWYGTPGYHYGIYDPPGERGPYAYNGGLCECD